MYSSDYSDTEGDKVEEKALTNTPRLVTVYCTVWPSILYCKQYKKFQTLFFEQKSLENLILPNLAIFINSNFTNKQFSLVNSAQVQKTV